MFFSTNVSYSSLPVFLPSIINEMGFDAIDAQGLSAPPFFLAFLTTLCSTWIADRLQQRGIVLVTMSTIGAIGYTILASSSSVPARYFAVYLAAGGVFPVIGNILPWVVSKNTSKAHTV